MLKVCKLLINVNQKLNNSVMHIPAFHLPVCQGETWSSTTLNKNYFYFDWLPVHEVIHVMYKLLSVTLQTSLMSMVILSIKELLLQYIQIIFMHVLIS